jgi:hypothetical protein
VHNFIGILYQVSMINRPVRFYLDHALAHLEKARQYWPSSPIPEHFTAETYYHALQLGLITGDAAKERREDVVFHYQRALSKAGPAQARERLRSTLGLALYDLFVSDPIKKDEALQKAQEVEASLTLAQVDYAMFHSLASLYTGLYRLAVQNGQPAEQFGYYQKARCYLLYALALDEKRAQWEEARDDKAYGPVNEGVQALQHQLMVEQPRWNDLSQLGMDEFEQKMEVLAKRADWELVLPQAGGIDHDPAGS